MATMPMRGTSLLYALPCWQLLLTLLLLHVQLLDNAHSLYSWRAVPADTSWGRLLLLSKVAAGSARPLEQAQAS
jgi:hypothetical protein